MRATPYLVTIALASSTIFLPSASANAAIIDALCTGNETVRYSPGLTLSRKETAVDVSTVHPACVSSDPAITSDTGTVHFTDDLSCADISIPGMTFVSTTREITWNTTETSTLKSSSSTVTRTPVATTRVTTGTVTSGKFSGDTYTAAVVLANTQLLSCLLAPHGLTQVTGISTLTITGSS